MADRRVPGWWAIQPRITIMQTRRPVIVSDSVQPSRLRYRLLSLAYTAEMLTGVDRGWDHPTCPALFFHVWSWSAAVRAWLMGVGDLACQSGAFPDTPS